MWTLWLCLGLTCLVVGQWLFFRRTKSRWQGELHGLQDTVAEQEELLSAQKALCAQKTSAVEALTTQLAQKDVTVETLTVQLTQKEATIENLTAQLTQKEATVENLTAQLAQTQAQLEALTPPQKLYLPNDDPPEPPPVPPVYYNENTGIYHMDRACAPYQAIPLTPEQLPPHARPCKKCTEGHLFPTPPETTQEENPESQLSLFDLG